MKAKNNTAHSAGSSFTSAEGTCRDESIQSVLIRGVSGTWQNVLPEEVQEFYLY